MTLHDPKLCKLGRSPVRRDPRTLKLSAYVPLPEPPPAVSWSPAVKEWGLMGNDRWGDCTCAGWGHLHLLRTTLCGSPVLMTDDQVIDLYEDITGIEGARFDPKTGDNDNGCVELDVLKYLRDQGDIGGYAFVNPLKNNLVRFTIDAFEGIYMGCALPISAQSQDVWDAPAGQALTGDFEPGSWGGHCLCPGTRILTADLRWVPIETIMVGDDLVAFEEERTEKKRQFRSGKVQATKRLTLPCYELEFDDGTIVRASEDHLWLTTNGWGETKWTRTDAMRTVEENGPERDHSSKVVKLMQPWEYDESRDAGYLAASFDGEGWIDGEQKRAIHAIGFTQKPNIMLDYVRNALSNRGFSFREYTKAESGFGSKDIPQIILGQKQQLLRFLGSIRPHRLMEKFDPDRLGYFHETAAATLVRKTAIGDQEVIALQTSTRTYISEGLASHNCMIAVDYDSAGPVFITWGQKKKATWAWWNAYVDPKVNGEAYAILSNDLVNGSKPAPSGFDLDQLKADLSALG